MPKPTRITLRLTFDGIELVAEYADPTVVTTTGETVSPVAVVLPGLRKCAPVATAKRVAGGAR
jgi:hypothetical protein